ncbi:MAG: CoA transferase, partial [Pseudonocardiales bacterium]|nr:CoA transferase [Pseudonocardiales bacterium]
GRYAVFSRSGRTGAKLVPGVGEHTADVLREAGYDARQTADLALSGVVVQGGPMEHRLTAPYR